MKQQNVPAFLKGREDFITQVEGETKRFQFFEGPSHRDLISWWADNHLGNAPKIEPSKAKVHDTKLLFFSTAPYRKVFCYVEAGEEYRAEAWAEEALKNA